MKTEKHNSETTYPNIGEQFQEETKYTPEKLGGYVLDWNSVPDTYKDYENPIARIALPQPELAGDMKVWKAIEGRRSRRMYLHEKTLPLPWLSTLLWATQGLTAKWGDTFFRTSPSAGGLYPVETYLSVRKAGGLEPGLYHFRPGAFDVEYVKEGDMSTSLAHGALDQMLVMSAQVTFIWSALMARGKWKYRQRAYRYIYLDAGHIAENLYLAGEALGAIGAFYDDMVNGLMGLDGTGETVIYMATVGFPSGVE